jgi:hypothetical protein
MRAFYCRHFSKPIEFKTQTHNILEEERTMKTRTRRCLPLVALIAAYLLALPLWATAAGTAGKYQQALTVHEMLQSTLHACTGGQMAPLEKLFAEQKKAGGLRLQKGRCYNPLQAGPGSAPAIKKTAVRKKTSGITAGAGSITGTVIDGSSNPIENVEVSVYDSSDSSAPVEYGMTDATGAYAVTGLSTGSYKVEFDPSYANMMGGNYSGEWYNDKAGFDTADGVGVTDGAATGSINAQLATAGSIAGTVTDGSNPIEGVMVTVASGIYFMSGYYAMTAADGTYTVTGLPAGSYKVGFDPSSAGNYIGEYYNNKTDPCSADDVSVAAGEAKTGINAQLATGGSIAGTVTDGSSNPIEDVEVIVTTGMYDFMMSGNYYATTAADGTYTVTGLPAGSYKVEFDPSSAGNYIGEWYNNKADFCLADDVSLAAGEAKTSINAQLAAGGVTTTTTVSSSSTTTIPASSTTTTITGGSIAGRVTDSSGKPLMLSSVEVFDLSHNHVAGTGTDDNGTYIVSGLPAGSYKVMFDASFANMFFCGNYAYEWYNNSASFDTATPVSLAAGEAKTGINAQLATGGSIAGTVTDSGSSPIANVFAIVYDLSGDAVSYAYTDVNGAYTATGLPTGSYKVAFETFDIPCGNYADEWYNDKPDFDTATPVNVTAGATMPNINAQLAAGSGTTTTTMTITTTIPGGSTTTTTPGGSTTTTVSGGSTTTTVSGGSTTTTVSGGSTTTTVSGGSTTTTTPGGSTTTTVSGGSTTTTTTGGCPSRKALGEDKQSIEQLHVFRDRTLAQSAVGRRIIQMYYNNADSISAALESNPALMSFTHRVLEVIAPMVGKMK